MSLKTVLGALRDQTSSDNETTPKIKIEFPLDRAVKWLCLRAVGALATFLIAMFEFFKAQSSISCAPIKGPNGTMEYDATKAEYDRLYCLENMVDFSSANNKEPTLPVFGISGRTHGKVLYQRYFPYVLVAQALICACPVLLWKLYSLETMTSAVKFVKEKLEAMQNIEETEVKADTKKKPATYGEFKKQVKYWWKQTSLIKLYLTKLILHQIVFIFVICFYFCFDAFSILEIKAGFVCYVDKKELVNCNLPGSGILRLAWVANIVLVALALLLNTLQLANITCCKRKPKQAFLHQWRSFVDEEPKKQQVFLNDAQMIAAICRENLSKLPPTSAEQPAELVKDSN